MITIIETPELKIYRDGQLSHIETYWPQYHDKIMSLGSKVCHWFETSGEWPTEPQSSEQ